MIIIKNYHVNITSIENGETIAYRQVNAESNLPTLLLIHGNMSSSIHLQTVMEGLSPYYHIVAPDYPGFGDSSYEKEHSSLFEFC